MEESLQCLILGACCLLGGVLMFAFWTMVGLTRTSLTVDTSQYREKNKASWQTLAEANNLKFVQVRSNSLKGAYVKGSYRGHQLTLENDCTEMSTRVIVPMDYSDDKIAIRRKNLVEPISKEEQKRIASLINAKFQLKGRIKAQTNRQKIIYEQPGVEQDIAYLQSIFDLICDLVEIYPEVVARGGGVVSSLEEIINTNPGLKPIVVQMLEDIEYETKKQWANLRHHLVCHECLTRCAIHKVETSESVLFDAKRYYGCRICGQSQKFLEAKRVVARLDSRMKEDWSLEDNILQVNWLNRRTLFDFEEIKIVKATDEEVERFVIQVGNDTDEVRKVRYQDMTCEIWPECNLSDNTMRILQHIFGNITISEVEV